MVLAIQTEDDPLVKEYFYKVSKNLENTNIFENPFQKGKVFSPVCKEVFYLLRAKVVYPPFFWYGLIAVLVGELLGHGWRVLTIIGLLVFSLGFFWSYTFLYLIIKIQLRKKGYRGTLKRTSSKRVLASIVDFA